jgi:hypothetical protein
MFALVLLLVAQSDAPEPAAQELTPAFREYFQKADVWKSESMKTLEAQIVALKDEKTNAAGNDKKIAAAKQLGAAQVKLWELKEDRVSMYLPESPEVGQLGALNSSTVKAVVDGTTVVVNYFVREQRMVSGIAIPERDRGFVLVQSLERDRRRSGQPFYNSRVYRVVAVSTPEKRLEADERLKGIDLQHEKEHNGLVMIVEPVSRADIAKYRKLYEHEQKNITPE